MSEAFFQATRFLSRREYGEEELFSRLLQKGFSEPEAREALQRCQDLGLQNDERFAEVVCRTRIRQGYGPARIERDLKQKGIDHQLIKRVLLPETEHWLLYACDVWIKKYAGEVAESFSLLQKQKKFLLYRGFSPALIDKVVSMMQEQRIAPKDCQR